MPIKENELKSLLNNAFPESKIEAKDLAGDEDHWEVKITWAGFAGKSMIQQHRMVQEAVKGKDIHALSIKTNSDG